MVGVSRRDIAAVARWFGGLSARMRVLILAGLALLIVLLVWSVANARQEAKLVRPDPDLLPAQTELTRWGAERGHGLYQSRCASCHGTEGRGHYRQGVPNLTDKDYLYGTGQVSDIEQVVLYGIRAPNSRTWKLADMPAFGKAVPYPREKAMKPLTPGDIKDVIQFLHSVEGKPFIQESAIRGGALFADRGGCYDCHAPDAKGEPEIGGPNLSDNVWLYGDGSDEWLFQSIAQGRAGQCPAWFDRLSAVKIRELALYVYSLSHGSAKPKPSEP
jgi:cytochrome c oxidase cbb3-type subunit 3